MNVAVEKYKNRQKIQSKKALEIDRARAKRAERQRLKSKAQTQIWLDRRLAIARELARQKTVSGLALASRCQRYFNQEPQLIRDVMPLHEYLGWTLEEYEHWEGTQELPK